MAATWRIGALMLTAAGILHLVLPASAQNVPTRYALVIGLNEFRNLNGTMKPLLFANQDARDVAAVLERHGFKVTPLINPSARREDIVGELNRLARTITREDTFVLFFAGHGVQNASVSDTSTYWLTYDARLDAPDVEGIRLEHLMDYVRDIRAARKLVLLDHCFSGRVTMRAAPAPGSLDATQPGARGGGEDTLAVARGTEPVPGWATVRGPRAEGLVVIGASRDLAFERDGHGLFTSALLTALGSRAADTNNNGKLTAAELLAFLPQQMRVLATKYELTQQVEDLVEGKALGEWEIVSALPIDNVDDAKVKRQHYNDILTRWVGRTFLPAVVKMRCMRLVDKWFASVSGGPIDATDRALFEQIRGLLEDQAPEQERAQALADFVAAACAANPQSDLCR